MRALLVAMIRWVRGGEEPPPTAVPSIAGGALVPVDRFDFPAIPDLAQPRAAHLADRLDFGPEWARGVVTREPPGMGEPFPVLVPGVDSLGNEVGGIRTVELEAPLATYTPWNLRVGMPGDTTELTRILGTYLPLPRTEAERRAAGDPRPSIERLYPGREAYLRRARAAAERLVERRMLLPDDLDRVTRRAAEEWEWIHSR
jgi:hypothetical protein